MLLIRDINAHPMLFGFPNQEEVGTYFQSLFPEFAINLWRWARGQPVLRPHLRIYYARP